jgi:hypothetical protein
MMPGDLSESNLVKPTDYSKFFNVLAYSITFVSGVIINAIIIFSLIIHTGSLGAFGAHPVVLALIFFLTFLLTGAVLGFLWSKEGWRLGLSLAGSALICWSLFVLFRIFLYGININFEVITTFFIVSIPALMGGCLGTFLGASFRQQLRPNKGVV